MIKKGNIKKSIKEIYKDFNTKYGFTIYKGNMLIRESNDILQIVYFKLASSMECELVIQPLFIPEKFVVLTFACELFKLNRSVPMYWDYTETMEEFEPTLINIKGYLEEQALFWFNEVDSPSKIISYIEKGLVPNRHNGFTPLIQMEMLGYCYMYLGEEDLALKTFAKLRNSYNPAFVSEEKLQEIDNIISIINEGLPAIQNFIKENIEYTKGNIKLK